jgi:hypothetical protein
MNLNRSIIRRLIAEEISKAAPKKRSLASYLFEDVEDDIKKAATSGPAAVRKFVDAYDDKKELKSALQGSHDKRDDDDIVAVGGAESVSVGGLIPTQKEIDLMKSVAFPLGGFEALKKMVTSKTSGAPGAITISGNEVLDGHHRWSGVWGISGPGGTITAQNVDLPGDTSQKLAAAQLAIAAYKDPEAKQPSAAGEIPYNILGKDKATVKAMIIDNVGKKTDKKAPGALLNDEMLEACSNDKDIADWAGFKVGADKETVKDKIADRVAENLAGAKPIPSNPGAPERVDMPQFDDAAIGGSKAKEDIYSGLSSGEFNVSEPFSPKKESVASEDKIIMERWQKLAGILKS